MLRKLRFFLIGLVPGLILVFFILNKKGARCSGYLPNSRVIAETLSKKFQYSPNFQQEMYLLKLDEKFLRDSIITPGEINFAQSNTRREPCPDYTLKTSQYEITFEKCKEKATFTSLKKLK